MTALPTLRGGQNSQAYWINNQGQVVGFAENGTSDSTCSSSVPFHVRRFEAVIWGRNGEIHELRPLPGDTVGFAFGINDNGQAVGSLGLCSNTPLPPVRVNGPHAVLWERDGSPTDLGNLGCTISNIATTVNDLGDVVGTSQLTDGSRLPLDQSERDAGSRHIARSRRDGTPMLQHPQRQRRGSGLFDRRDGEHARVLLAQRRHVRPQRPQPGLAVVSAGCQLNQ
jgi:hypothetical protein